MTLVIFLIFVSCFFFLAWMKPHGTQLWATITGLVLAAGLLVAKKRAPEIQEIAQTDSHMDLILHLAESSDPEAHIFFRRPREESLEASKTNEAYVTLYHPRQGAPPRLAANHFRFSATRRGVYPHIVALLKVIEYELTDRRVTIHFGWPLSSWLDRISIGVMVFNLMRLPRQFPHFNFVMSYPGKPYRPRESS